MPENRSEIDALREELQKTIKQLADYKHYASVYGNASGTCETGYPQHPNYICGRCRLDKSKRDKDGTPPKCRRHEVREDDPDA